MGTKGAIKVYDFDRVNRAHKETFGVEISDDWPYVTVCRVALKEKWWIIRYSDNQNDSIHRNYCDNNQGAAMRALSTLDKVGPVDICEVWSTE